MRKGILSKAKDLIVLSLVFLPLFVFAQEKASSDVTVELILDASGSMEEMISGKTKMQIAKAVLSKYAKNVNEKYNLGLRVYGNTKKRDCKDSHLIVPIAKNNRNQIISEIKDVTALSMTPIGYSLQKAAEDLKSLKDEGTMGIVLVTDGQESCNLDPCKVAKDIIKSGLQLKVNVIGFDIKDKQATDQLTCIAKATGGTYVTSDNADSLYKMLEKSVETVAKYDWNLRVEAPSSHESYTFDAIDEKTGKTVLERQYVDRGYLLSDGVYTIKINTKPEYVEQHVKLSQTKQTIVRVKGRGAITGKAPNSHETFYMTVKNEAREVVIKEGSLVYSSGYLVPVGKYTVELTTRSGSVVKTKKDVVVEENELTTVSFEP